LDDRLDFDGCALTLGGWAGGAVARGASAGGAALCVAIVSNAFAIVDTSARGTSAFAAASAVVTFAITLTVGAFGSEDGCSGCDPVFASAGAFTDVTVLADVTALVDAVAFAGATGFADAVLGIELVVSAAGAVTAASVTRISLTAAVNVDVFTTGGAAGAVAIASSRTAGSGTRKTRAV
jgi:hypothetical protein